MISLDQILLLEKKVESAVAKIAQLQAENDALRSKCSELTNALSSKSEQLSTFEQDQSKIESGIMNALDRLASIENSVLKAAGQLSEGAQENTASETSKENTFSAQNTLNTQNTPPAEPGQDTNQGDIFTAEQIQQESSTQTENESFTQDSQDYDDSETDENAQFDIF